MELNRRDFLKGTLAAGALAATGTALAACSPSSGGAEGGVAASSSDGAAGVLTADNYREMKWSFEIPPAPVADSDIGET